MTCVWSTTVDAATAAAAAVRLVYTFPLDFISCLCIGTRRRKKNRTAGRRDPEEYREYIVV